MIKTAIATDPLPRRMRGKSVTVTFDTMAAVSIRIKRTLELHLLSGWTLPKRVFTSIRARFTISSDGIPINAEITFSSGNATEDAKVMKSISRIKHIHIDFPSDIVINAEFGVNA